jgi:cyclopropane-fatty-acyl-phospholipid synthase
LSSKREVPSLRRFHASGSVKVLLLDHRLFDGEYDKIVSVEMFETVGLAHENEFFGTRDRLRTRHGSMLMQTVTIPERELAEYGHRVDWVQTLIVPRAANWLSSASFKDRLQR